MGAKVNSKGDTIHPGPCHRVTSFIPSFGRSKRKNKVDSSSIEAHNPFKKSSPTPKVKLAKRPSKPTSRAPQSPPPKHREVRANTPVTPFLHSGIQTTLPEIAAWAEEQVGIGRDKATLHAEIMRALVKINMEAKFDGLIDQIYAQVRSTLNSWFGNCTVTQTQKATS